MLDVRCPNRVELRVGAVVRCEVQLDAGSRVAIGVRMTDLDGGFQVLPPDRQGDGSGAGGDGAGA